MEYLQLIACFFSGAFLVNVIPHLVAGIQGNKFPTPFANPPGKGLSSPTLNVAWSLGNLLVGALLFQRGQVAGCSMAALVSFFAGIAVLSLWLSKRFSEKHRE